MQNLYDPRDRTTEFLTTVSTLQRQRNIATPPTANGHHSAVETPPRSMPPQLTAQSSMMSRRSPIPLIPTLSDGSLDDASAPLLSSSGASPPTQPKQRKMFTVAAKQISGNIGALTEKLTSLGQLARHRSLFNDPAQQINTLTAEVKRDLSSIDRELTALQEFVMSGRADDDILDSERKSAQSQSVASAHTKSHSNAVVANLKSQLANSTKLFQSVLEERTKTLKEQQTRRKQFETVERTSTTPLRKRANPLESLVSSEKKAAAAADEKDYETTSADDQYAGHIDTADVQAQAQAMAVPAQDEAYYSARADAVESIESTIKELGSMYSRLAQIVAMQDEMVVRIDTNMDTTLANVDAANSALTEYFNNISNNRWLILKIFAVLIAFLVFFMIFVA